MNKTKTFHWAVPALLSIGLMLVGSLSYSEGAPVIDFSNQLQNIKIINNQVTQYKNQLKLYDNLLTNTKSLKTYQWDDANQTITNLINTTNVLESYKKEAGNLEGYLNRYQSEEYYSKRACFNGNCSEEALNKIKENRLRTSVAQKRANDALIRGIDIQQSNIKTDAARLRTLQKQAEGAGGQKQAIQAAAQLASAQTNQLMQIRSLLISQQQAQIVRAAALANQEAMIAAGDEQFRAGTFRKSSVINW